MVLTLSVLVSKHLSLQKASIAHSFELHCLFLQETRVSICQISLKDKADSKSAQMELLSRMRSAVLVDRLERYVKLQDTLVFESFYTKE